MAGSNAGFSPSVFRKAIRDTMIMGLPQDVSERATFQWKPEREFPIQDPIKDPYDWTATPDEEELHADVQIPVAVEFSARPAGSTLTELGEFDTSRAVLTILDEDFSEIEGANVVLLGGNTYNIQFVGPPIGLFSVTVFQVYCQAADES